MSVLVLSIVIIIFAAIKTINFGRWVGRRGNRRGAFGLYFFTLLVVVIPPGVYLLIQSR
jgi:hypothetical protein